MLCSLPFGEFLEIPFMQTKAVTENSFDVAVFPPPNIPLRPLRSLRETLRLESGLPRAIHRLVIDLLECLIELGLLVGVEELAHLIGVVECGFGLKQANRIVAACEEGPEVVVEGGLGLGRE